MNTRVVSILGIFLLGLSQSVSAETPTICTMEYAPVCGSVQVQCIKAPCNPVKQTFGNSCMAKAAQAMDIVQWECEVDTKPIGGDKDAHGCLVGAGYSWNKELAKCVRPWEIKARIFTIAPKTASCTGVTPMECLRVKIGAVKTWSNWYQDIVGFTYEPGYTYRLRVLSEKIENPPADGSSINYTLSKVIAKIPLAGTTWKIDTLNGKKIQTPATLSFTQNKIQAKICNNIFGTYSLKGDTLKTPWLASTMMYCEWDGMTLESALDLDEAKWLIKDSSLTLTTKKGDIIIWKL